MSAWDAIEASIAEATGRSFTVCAAQRAHDGCIHESWMITDGARRYFVKRGGANERLLFEAERAGLKAWSQAAALRVPETIVQGDSGGASWLVLEWVDMAPLHGPLQRTFGIGLAQLHQCRAPRFGWERDNHIGRTPQTNRWDRDWPTFFRDQRLGDQFERAARKGIRFRNSDRLLEALPNFYATYDPQPGLIHGDLWSGNVAATRQGEPIIFDPATYFADPEADFGLLFMFGGVTEDFWRGYESVTPLAKDFEKRVPLYRLYHELNHENLFGGYAAQAQRSIDEALRNLK